MVTLPSGAVANAERPWQIRRRQRIVQAAGAQFAEQPFSQVHMDMVARRAGIGKPTLYRYFASKEALFLAVVDGALAGLERQFDAILAAGMAPPEALAAMLRALGDVLADQLRSLRVLDGENAELARRWRSTYRQRREGIVAGMRRVIEAGTQSGDFAALDPAVVPGMLIGMIRGGLAGAPEQPRERVVAAAIALVMAGVLARSRAAEGIAPPRGPALLSGSGETSRAAD